MIKPYKSAGNVSPSNIDHQSPNTTHISVIDKDGMIVSLTQTINYWFGSGITVPGRGFILNNEIYDFSFEQESPNAPEGGKRPLSSMSPTIICKDGKSYISLGTPGATRIITALTSNYN